MVTVLTKQYKVVCDRCGKTEYTDNTPEKYFEPLNMGSCEVKFSNADRIVAKGDVCNECYDAFIELAHNFFDDVNKENEGKPVEKPKAIVLSNYSNNHFGTMYKCPLCDRVFGSWEVDEEDVRCPGCEAELGGIE